MPCVCLPERVDRESSLREKDSWISLRAYLEMSFFNCGVVVENNLDVEEELVDVEGEDLAMM